MISRKTLKYGFYIHRKFLHASPSLLQEAQLDKEYLLNPQNLQEISHNIKIRKGVGDIQRIHELKRKLETLTLQTKEFNTTHKELHMELLKIPNRTHPEVARYKDSPRIVKEVGSKLCEHGLKEFQEITKRLKLVRTEQLGNLSGSKSYYLLGEMAELEHALVKYVVESLIKNKFELVSVPDILPRDVIEGCGMNTRGTRTQVYSLDSRLHALDLCLSGTSEMALAGFLSNKTLDNLPLKLAAVSRCYRAETSNLLEERGIYRVHEFTKVEMFVATTPNESPQVLEDIRDLQETIFTNLGLQFKVLDMPPHELGAQAFRKYDIEAWLSGRKIYGEISSCSDCLDYQARRLGIKYSKGGDEGFVHTLNGTACAIPRLLIALVEMGQNKNGTITIPEVLRGYMGGKSVIGKQKSVPELKLIKNKK